MNKFRKNLRLPDFDYSHDGAYFVTIVTQRRVCLLGKIIDQEMVLNGAGEMIDQVCREITNLIPRLYLDFFQIMPNHFHGIFTIEKPIIVGAGLRACPGRQRRVTLTLKIVYFSNWVSYKWA